MIKNLKKVLRTIYDNLFYVYDEKVIKVGQIDTWNIYDKLSDCPLIFSGGAGKDITFELDLVSRFNAIVHLYDPSPTGLNTFAKVVNKKNLIYHEFGLAKTETIVEFNLPINPDEGSFSKVIDYNKNIIQFKCKKLSKILIDYPRIDLLKLDIEGFEYEVIEDIIDNSILPKQICCEFHHYFESISFFDTLKTIRLLKKNGYIIKHKVQNDFLFVHRDLLN